MVACAARRPDGSSTGGRGSADPSFLQQQDAQHQHLHQDKHKHTLQNEDQGIQKEQAQAEPHALEDAVTFWSPIASCSKHEIELLAEHHLQEWEKCEEKAAQARERTMKLSAYEMRERTVQALEKLQLEKGYNVKRLKSKLQKVEEHRKRVSSKFGDYMTDLEAKTNEISPVPNPESNSSGLRKLLSVFVVLFAHLYEQ